MACQLRGSFSGGSQADGDPMLQPAQTENNTVSEPACTRTTPCRPSPASGTQRAGGERGASLASSHSHYQDCSQLLYTPSLGQCITTSGGPREERPQLLLRADYATSQQQNLPRPTEEPGKKKTPYLPQDDHRITECLGLEGTSVGHPVQHPAEAGSPTAGCTGPCPGGS